MSGLHWLYHTTVTKMATSSKLRLFLYFLSFFPAGTCKRKTPFQAELPTNDIKAITKNLI